MASNLREIIGVGDEEDDTGYDQDLEAAEIAAAEGAGRDTALPAGAQEAMGYSPIGGAGPHFVHQQFGISGQTETGNSPVSPGMLSEQ